MLLSAYVSYCFMSSPESNDAAQLYKTRSLSTHCIIHLVHFILNVYTFDVRDVRFIFKVTFSIFCLLKCLTLSYGNPCCYAFAYTVSAVSGHILIVNFCFSKKLSRRDGRLSEPVIHITINIIGQMSGRNTSGGAFCLSSCFVCQCCLCFSIPPTVYPITLL